ncbi:MAG: phosphoribosylglycinamide formyltransferase [Candidatus Thermoplasmatota archaeon]
MGEKTKIGVLASGRGTDLQSIIDASKEEKIDAKVTVVVSDNKEAYALERAKKNSIEAVALKSETKKDSQLDRKINSIMKKYQVDLIVGAGFMRILSLPFVKEWYGNLINIHPALLPSFKGVNGQGDALEYGVKITGCTTHFMDEKMDHGPIILQAAVKVLPDDDRDKLAERILKVEHQILPRTVDLFTQNRLKIQGRKVKIKPGDSWKNKYETFPDVLYPEGY